MDVVDAIVLGTVQGVTEFLPISSDGHLALGFKLLGIPFALDFVVFLHFPTLLAILAYFWRDVLRLLSALLPSNAHRAADRRLVGLIVVGTVVSGVLALGLEPLVEQASRSSIAIGAGFLLTTVLLILGEALSPRAQAAEAEVLVEVRNADAGEVELAASELPWHKAVLVGFMQGLAVLPGVSRSGSTIAAGMFSGLTRSDAARYSFLLGIPIITLAAAKDALEMVSGVSALPGTPQLVAGFLAAGAAGYAAIWGLLKIVRNHSLYWFAAYTGVVGMITLSIGLTGRG